TTTVYVTHDQTEAMTLGDRVAVMRAGEIQQVGPPQELYDEPVNLFVAGFIGSPAMNFLLATPDGDSVQTMIGKVPIARARREAIGDDNVILGIRPEHLMDPALVDERVVRTGLTFEADVDLVESLGSDKFAYLPMEGER